MPSKTYHAHSLTGVSETEWQILSEHLNNVGDLAGQFAAAFGAAPYAEAMGKLHDLGKYTVEFQNRLRGGPRCDHSSWGARIAREHFGVLMGHLMAFGIAGHHAGLANGIEEGKRRPLAERISNENVLPELDSVWKQDISLPAEDELKQALGGLKLKGNRKQFQQSLFTRMLFSCLVDADYLDTEAFYDQAEGRQSRRANDTPTLHALRDRLNQYLSQFKADSPVNILRANILSSVRSKSTESPGLFSLTVPTGGGKTLASLAFALDHAIAHGLRRVIYVIPFTSIVEQNAAVFRKAFGDLGDLAVLEHHSAFIDDNTQNVEAKDKLKLAMENWDAPIIVTTAVQFFESLFASRTSSCRKLHNIAGSVVILDEAQTLPLRLLMPCVTVLNELALNYRVSIVLCTATQPALHEPEFVGGFDSVTELAPNLEELFEKFKRVRVSDIGTLDDEAISDQLKSHDQILCIVNNRQQARALFESIASFPGACHLSTFMCAKHRSTVLSNVRQLLKEGKPCRLISTSLIEAGVDVDFPTVLRAKAGLDSIAQAAGRCNREGHRSIQESEVKIFSTANPAWMPAHDLKQFAQVTRSVLRRSEHKNDPLSLQAIKHYFGELYGQKGASELDKKALLKRIEASTLEYMPFEVISNDFCMIEIEQLPIIIPFDDHIKQILIRLEKSEKCGSIARGLQPYIVQVDQKIYEQLNKLGMIEPIAPDRFGEQFIRLVNDDFYNKHYGLFWADSSKDV